MTYVDGGTTQTRAWSVKGTRVLAEARVAVGARDTARDGSPARLRTAVRDLLAQVGGPTAPSLIVAAGMVTSPQGLCELPHVAAPADAAALRAGARLERQPDLATAPMLFIPGVRSGPHPCDAASVLHTDAMRGEEVLCLGLAAAGLLPAGGVVLNLGSHWKAVAVDAGGFITGSVTTLSGELVHAVGGQTILASALPAQRPDVLMASWIDAGAAACDAAGLSRALFCVRLLEQRAPTLPEQRYAFLMGAVIAADRPTLVPDASGGQSRRVLLTGAHVVADAWAGYLARRGLDAMVVSEADVDRAFRAGCAAVVAAGRSGAA